MTAYTGPERRVLDPNQRAEYAFAPGGFVVVAGEGRVFRATFDDAYVTAYVHNSMNGFDVRTDRRAS